MLVARPCRAGVPNVFQVRVIDLDPELSGRSREVVVKVIADRMGATDPAAVRAGGVRQPHRHPVRATSTCGREPSG